jgi:hypothetical protein
VFSPTRSITVAMVSPDVSSAFFLLECLLDGQQIEGQIRRDYLRQIGQGLHGKREQR